MITLYPAVDVCPDSIIVLAHYWHTAGSVGELLVLACHKWASIRTPTAG